MARSPLQLLARRIANLQRQIKAEFSLAEDLRQSPDLAERIDTTPLEAAAAAALRALDDLVDEIEGAPTPWYVDTIGVDRIEGDF